MVMQHRLRRRGCGISGEGAKSSRPSPAAAARNGRRNADYGTDSDSDGDARDDTRKKSKSETPREIGVALRTKRRSTKQASRYYVAKWMVLRLLGIVYFVAFLGAYNQNEGLMGVDGGGVGIVPATSMEYLEEQYARIHGGYDGSNNTIGAQWRRFRNYPTIFWWVPLTDTNMRYLIQVGMAAAALVGFGGINSCYLLAVLWLLDFSIVTAASNNSFYSYGWESQLLETGFLGIFLCDLPSWSWTRLRIPLPRLALWESSTASSPPSPFVLWLFRWLCFRISIGAGLIKLRGSSCWTAKTCLHYHFETQPIPSPLSFVFHFLPPVLQRRMVDVDLWVQVYTSAFVLISLEVIPRSFPRWLYRLCRGILRAGGVVQAGFMVAIIMSGNFAFLNHLTVIPALACLDDDFLPRRLREFVIPVGTSTSSAQARVGDDDDDDDDDGGADDDDYDYDENDRNVDDDSEWDESDYEPLNSDEVESLWRSSTRRATSFFWLEPSRRWFDAALLLWIAVLSWPVVANLLRLNGARQLMNASFDPLRIVGTYGAFGSVGEARYEPIIRISNGTAATSRPTTDTTANETEEDSRVELDQDGYPVQEWVEVEFPCKPGNVRRRPCFCAPYHYRLDWNIWFLGFKPHLEMLRYREDWLYGLLAKIVQPLTQSHRRPWLALLDRTTADYLWSEYYAKGLAPKSIRVDMYRYRMAKSLWGILWDYVMGRDVVWWTREYEEALVPPVVWDESRKRGLRMAYGTK